MIILTENDDTIDKSVVGPVLEEGVTLLPMLPQHVAHSQGTEHHADCKQRGNLQILQYWKKITQPLFSRKKNKRYT
jgi:hypothetical protein